jgi:enoyl-CoA hydratase
MKEGLVRLKKEEAIAIVTLDNPPVNAVSSKLKHDLHARLDEVEKDTAIRCVILAGAGEKAYCASGDLREEKDFGSPEASAAFRALV